MPHRVHKDGSVTLDVSIMPTYCNACDQNIPPGQAVWKWLQFDQTIETPGCEPCNGIWEQAHEGCIKAGDEVRYAGPCGTTKARVTDIVPDDHGLVFLLATGGHYKATTWCYADGLR